MHKGQIRIEYVVLMRVIVMQLVRKTNYCIKITKGFCLFVFFHQNYSKNNKQHHFFFIKILL